MSTQRSDKPTVRRLAAVVALIGGAMISLSAPRAYAQAGHSHGAANIPIPETAEAVFAEIQKQHAAITASVTGKNLKAVHDRAEAMTALAKALPDKLADDKKERAQASANNMTKLLDTLHHAADDNDLPRAGIELKKLDSVVTALEKQLK